jgi:LPS export ABC transporter protein LptC
VGCGPGERDLAEACPELPAPPSAPGFTHQGAGPDLPTTPDAVDPPHASWPEYLLQADSGYAMPGAGTARLCGVHLVVRDSLGRTVAEVTAAAGEFDADRETVVARGDVVVVMPQQQRRLETEELHFAPREDRVWSPTSTLFQEGGVLLTGTGFVADSRFENLRLERARGRFPLP